MLFRKTMVLFLMMVFAVQMFSKALIMLDYAVNTTAYAIHCVNKQKPRLGCNGKCQMAKKMMEEERQSQDNAAKKIPVGTDFCLFTKSCTAIPVITILSHLSYTKFHPAGNEIKMPRSLLRPPIA